jgi:hypothetical protein
MGGEYRALSEADPQLRSILRPLIEVRARAEGGRIIGLNPINNLPLRLAKSIGPGWPFLLDFPWMVGAIERSDGEPAMQYVFSGCRRRSLDVVPVARLGRDARYLSYVAEAAAEDGRGACIRIPRTSVVGPAAGRLTDYVRQLLRTIGLTPTETDLMLDLKYVDAKDAISAEQVAEIINNLPNLREWRTLILASSSMPASLGAFPKGFLSDLYRQEWFLWQDLLNNSRLRRIPTFSDYAIQHPDPPIDLGGRAYANVRYSTPDFFIIARGPHLEQQDREQYVDLCAELITRPEFKGAAYSAGDAYIANCASRIQIPGSLTDWRFAGTSHHLRQVVDQINSS